MDLKIFIVCDLDIALSRRILRDIKERGRDVKEVLGRYNRFIKQGFEKYVKPQMKYADLIVPGGANNDSQLKSRLESCNGPHPDNNPETKDSKFQKYICYSC
jgi:uridine kinase